MKSLIRVKTPEYDEPLLDRLKDWRRCYELPVTEVHVPMEKVVQALADLAGLRFTEAQTTVAREKFTIVESKA